MSATVPPRPSIGRVIGLAFLWFSLAVIAVALLYAAAFGPTDASAPSAQFLVEPDESVEQVGKALAVQGYVRSPFIFELAYLRATPNGKGIRPGQYEISKSMDAWAIGAALVRLPSVAWVKIPVGLRKEQIADLLADSLEWSDAQRTAWLAATASTSVNYQEGVYFPDTYFIPTDEDPALIAERMRNRFKEVFAPYAAEAVKKGIPWTKVVTIASLIQREAGSASDMPIISGIIQNRLKTGMPLAIDATLQYMEGNEENGWWPKPHAAATYPASPFNTYKETGLPPHPIANPGLVAINAALNPTATDCLFYIHDNNGQIHCSKTYSGQMANIKKYLR
ncbi:MAG: endolytic transglycosylase MltG [Bacillota bacterium]